MERRLRHSSRPRQPRRKAHVRLCACFQDSFDVVGVYLVHVRTTAYHGARLRSVGGAKLRSVGTYRDAGRLLAQHCADSYPVRHGRLEEVAAQIHIVRSHVHRSGPARVVPRDVSCVIVAKEVDAFLRSAIGVGNALDPLSNNRHRSRLT